MICVVFLPMCPKSWGMISLVLPPYPHPPSCCSNNLGMWLTTLPCHIIPFFLSPSYLFLSTSSNFCLAFLSSFLSQTTTHIIFITLFRTCLCLSSNLFIEKGADLTCGGRDVQFRFSFAVSLEKGWQNRTQRWLLVLVISVLIWG